MASYTESKALLDKIAQRATNNATQLARAREIIVAVISDLTAMQTEYTPAIQQLANDVAANASNDAWKLLGAERTLITSDFNALKTKAQNQLTAVDAT